MSTINSGYLLFRHLIHCGRFWLCWLKLFVFLLSDERDISNVLKCSLPLRDVHTGAIIPTNNRMNFQTHSSNPARHTRPPSIDLSDRIPNNKLNIDKSLPNLVGGEKPKFTVMRPYIDRDVRDKKSDSWVPSYV